MWKTPDRVPIGGDCLDSYDWRLWTLPELREVLIEAGFRRSTVYWQGSDEHAGDGVFLPVEKGEPDAGWIAYLVAEK